MTHDMGGERLLDSSCSEQNSVSSAVEMAIELSGPINGAG
jgi:hypothetical protein